MYGAEFEDELVFNTHDIGVHLKGFYVLNGWRVGKLNMSFKNFSKQIFRISARDFSLCLAGDSIPATIVQPDSVVTLLPGESADMSLSFSYRLDKYALTDTGKIMYLPEHLHVDLVPVPFTLGDSTYFLSYIGFRPKERGSENNKVRFNK